MLVLLRVFILKQVLAHQKIVLVRGKYSIGKFCCTVYLAISVYQRNPLKKWAVFMPITDRIQSRDLNEHLSCSADQGFSGFSILYMQCIFILLYLPPLGGGHTSGHNTTFRTPLLRMLEQNNLSETFKPDCEF